MSKINPSLVNSFELDYKKLNSLMQYKLPKSEQTFNKAYEIYTKTLNGVHTFEKGFNDLFLLRHDALMEVNKFLFDEDQEKLYDMKDDDEEGWSLYKEKSEEYRILDFFFTRLLNVANQMTVEGKR